MELYCPLHDEHWKLQNEGGTKAEILPKEKEVSEFHAEQAEFPSCEKKRKPGITPTLVKIERTEMKLSIMFYCLKFGIQF